MKKRLGEIERKTSETDIRLRLTPDGQGIARIGTGISFFDHMLTALTKHSAFDMELTCAGDLEIDDHHTVEDCALAIGAAIDQALGDKAGMQRFGSAYAPLDEALVRAVVDFSGRPYSFVALPLSRPTAGTLSTENVPHFFQSLASAGRFTLHIDLIRGENDHHKIEAAFKALALALRSAVMRIGDEIPSTKGVL